MGGNCGGLERAYAAQPVAWIMPPHGGQPRWCPLLASAAFHPEMHVRGLNRNHAIVLDLTCLPAAVHHGDSTDNPHFASRMEAAQPRLHNQRAVRAPPMYHEMQLAVQHGSRAGSLNGQPRTLLPTLRGYGLMVLVGILEALAVGAPSRLFLDIPNHCLA